MDANNKNMYIYNKHKALDPGEMPSFRRAADTLPDCMFYF